MKTFHFALILMMALVFGLSSCKKEVVTNTYEYQAPVHVPKYAYIKGMLIDSLTGLPANDVYMSQIINSGSCQQTIEVINGEFFFTYCTSICTLGNSAGMWHVCGLPTTHASFALADTAVVNAFTYYGVVSASFPLLSEGDTAFIEMTAIIE